MNKYLATNKTYLINVCTEDTNSDNKADFMVIESANLPEHKSVYFETGDALFEDFDYNTNKYKFASAYTNQIPHSAGTNKIKRQNITMRIPVAPAAADNKTKTALGTIGLALNGVSFFNESAAPGDQITNELFTFDQCSGHPQGSGIYHYHVDPICLVRDIGGHVKNESNTADGKTYNWIQDDGTNAGLLLGFLMDGFPVYGPVGSGEKDCNGIAVSNAIDAYNGHSHCTSDFADPIYHYHAKTANLGANNNNSPVFWITNAYYYGTPGSITNSPVSSGTTPPSGGTPPPGGGTTASSTPNILLIIADDMGVDATPGYNVGASKPKMPVLQDLSAKGLTFDAVWADPLCSPTRATVLTGRYGIRTTVLSADPPTNAIPLSETSIQKYLTQYSTYKSAVIGKWHLAGPNNGSNDNPSRMGVTHYAGLLGGMQDDYFNWTLTENGATSTVTEYSTTYFTNSAINWMGQQKSPWFLWLAYTAPHTPFHLPPNALHSSVLSGTDADINANPRDYYFAALEALDTEIGRLLGTVDRTNTIIIFIGDDGTPRRVVQAPYASTRSKGTLYQGGIHVPMIVSGAGVTRAGQREGALINTTDLFATVADLAGTGLTTMHDSQSFKNLLTGGSIQKRAFAYSEVSQDPTVGWAIRNEKYKLIDLGFGQELYNLAADPYENTNLISSGASEDTTAKAALQNLANDVRK
jgi:arylsulfatase A-like enzyme